MVRFDDRAVVLGEFEQINRQSVRLSLCLCLRLTLCPSVSVVTVYVSLSGFRSICVYLMFDSQSVCQSVLLSVNMSVWLVCICVCLSLCFSVSICRPICVYRLGVSQAQKAKVSGDERPRLRAS